LISLALPPADRGPDQTRPDQTNQSVTICGMAAPESIVETQITRPAFNRALESWGCGDLMGRLASLAKVDPKGFKHLERHWDRLLEMGLLRVADWYLTYLSNLLALIFTTEPSTLKRGRGEIRGAPSFDLEEAIKADPKDERILIYAEQEVARLSEKSIRKLRLSFNHKFQFELFRTKEQLEAAVFVIAFRNILTHNNGIINRRFLNDLASTVFETKLETGERLPLDTDLLKSIAGILDMSASDIDDRTIEKWKLPTVTCIWPENGPPKLVESSS
jgi:hypothetical protein